MVFPADTKSGHLESLDRQWRRVRRLVQVPKLTIHDIRATVSTYRSNDRDHDRLITLVINRAPLRGSAEVATPM